MTRALACVAALLLVVTALLSGGAARGARDIPAPRPISTEASRSAPWEPLWPTSTVTPIQQSITPTTAAPPAPPVDPPSTTTTTTPSREPSLVGTFTATCYSPPEFPVGQRTATGDPVGPGSIAVDPSVIPLGTHLRVEGWGDGVADDTGGAIRGRHIDVYIDDHVACVAYGVQHPHVSTLP